jgi:hypothetical protein
LLLRWFLLAALTGLAAWNSIGIARRLVGGSVEVAMVAALSFFGLVGAPVLLLGYTETLTARNLGGLAALLDVGLLVLLARGHPWRAYATLCAGSARAILAMVPRALRMAARARSFAFVILGAAVAIIGYALVITILVPATSWDGFLYHEPIVGFAIQNHGFAVVSLPPRETAQAINGYPRLCESLSIWFVIFTDRTLVELPNVLGAPALMVAVYGLARRAGDRLLSLTWASVAVLMPQVWAQLCQIHLDILVGFFSLAAIYFATRPVMRVRDAWITTLALALLLASKASALTLAPIIGVVAAGRLVLAHGRARTGATALAIVCALVTLLSDAALPLVKNLRHFKDPLWPVSYDNHLFGIHWKGLRTMEQMVADIPLTQTIHEIYEPPTRGFGDVINRGYGYAFAWVILPLGLVGLAALLASALSELARRRDTPTRNLGWVAVITVAAAFATPTLRGGDARYNIHIVAGGMVAITWMLRRPSWERARQGLIGAVTILSLFPFLFVDGFQWTWGMTDDVASVFLHPFEHHRAVAHPTFDRLGAERVRELHAGDRVAFDHDVGFIGALWNFEYSNEIRFLPSDPLREFLPQLAAYDPTWVAVGNVAARTELKKNPKWELVGDITGDMQVFRRRR